MLRALAVGSTLLAALGVVAAVTSPISPAAYRPAAPPALVGPLTPNAALRETERIADGRLDGPEDVAVDGAGRLYAGVADGRVLRLDPRADGEPEPFARVPGRPLGLDFDAAETLWVAASQAGLAAIDRDGRAARRVRSADGVAVGFADDVDVAPSGLVYFSDASTRHGPAELFRETLEARPWGRLIEYDPAADRARVALDGLYFANGVAVSADGGFVLVAETFRYRVRRLWLSGPRQGQAEVFADNLPGFPDGISTAPGGGFWVALYTVRNDLLDRWLHPRPWLKRLVARLPRRATAGAARYGLVLRLDAAGRIVRSLHDPGGRRFAAVTSVEQSGDALYLGSVEGSAIGRLRLR